MEPDHTYTDCSYRSRETPRLRPSYGNLSLLESLPVEIIQQIFLETCEVNLARASPLIALNLCCPYVYDTFLSRVFCQFTNALRRDIWCHPDGLAQSKEELTQLRREALKCRWLTWERFRNYRDAVIERVKHEGQATILYYEGFGANKDGVRNWLDVDLWLGETLVMPHKLFQHTQHRLSGSQHEFVSCLHDLKAQVDPHESTMIVTIWLQAIQDGNHCLVETLCRVTWLEPMLPYKPFIDRLEEAVEHVRVGGSIKLLASLGWLALEGFRNMETIEAKALKPFLRLFTAYRVCRAALRAPMSDEDKRKLWTAQYSDDDCWSLLIISDVTGNNRNRLKTMVGKHESLSPILPEEFDDDDWESDAIESLVRQRKLI